MNSKEYKKSLDKKVKDMTPEEKKKYGMLRTRESRVKKKEKDKMTVNPKTGENKGNIPNNKLKCFMKKTKGRVYKTCTIKGTNQQVRGKSKPKKTSKDTHVMPNGDIHTGKKHTKSSKLVKKASKK